MSYDISLKDPETGETIQFDFKHDLIGGTYAIGGTTEAWLNVTYNYSKFFYEHIDHEKGIRWLYGKTGAEAIPILEKAIEALASEPDDDYWKPTPGNAAAALKGLLFFAKARPDGLFAGD